METTILTVDYNMSRIAMVRAGNYYELVSCHGSHLKLFARDKVMFPCVGTGKVTFEPKLFSLNHVIELGDMKKEMKSQGFEPAKTEHLLAFGAAFPEKQLEYGIRSDDPGHDDWDTKKKYRSIIAPGSMAKTHASYHSWVRLTSLGETRLVGYESLGSDPGDRLKLFPYDHFLGVRVIQPKS